MATPIDFAALFDLSPNAYMVVDHELRYVAANKTYLELTASRLEDLLGTCIFDRFPNDPNDPNNAPAQMLRASFLRVLETGERDHLAYIPYRVPKKVGDRVVDELRIWSATHTPVRDAQGKVAFIFQHTVDVSDLHAKETNAEATGHEARTTHGVLERARAVQEEKTQVEAEREQMRVLFEQAPGFVCVLEGKNHVFRLANASYRALVARQDIVGKSVAEALPEVVGQGFIEILDRVYTTGEPFVGSGIRILLERKKGVPEELFLDFLYQPVRDRTGNVTGIFVEGHDVTRHKQAERAAEAFSAELQEQSREVTAALQRANLRIAELEAALANR